MSRGENLTSEHREIEGRERRRFKPCIWVLTEDGAHSFLTAVGERQVKVLWLPEGFEHLSKSEQLATVQHRVREQLDLLLKDTAPALDKVTGMVSDELMAELYQARRSGQSAVLILAGRDAPGDAARGRAKAFGVPVFRIATQGDLELRRDLHQEVNCDLGH